MASKLPGITFRVIPFAYVRVHNLFNGGNWEAATTSTFGGKLFPTNSIQLKSRLQDSMIEVQDSRDANTMKTYFFNAGADIAIIGNTLAFFETHMSKQPVDKSLDEILKEKKN